MSGDDLAAVHDGHAGVRELDVDLLADQPEGRRVAHVVDSYTVVGATLQLRHSHIS